MLCNMAFGDMIPVSEDEMPAPTKTADFLRSESLRYLLGISTFCNTASSDMIRVGEEEMLAPTKTIEI